MSYNYNYTLEDAMNILTGRDDPEHYIFSVLSDEDDLYLAWRTLMYCFGTSDYDPDLSTYVSNLPPTFTQDQLLEACKYYDSRTDDEWIYRGDLFDYDRDELLDYWGYDNERGSTLNNRLKELSNDK